jgi:hypothetical protein
MIPLLTFAQNNPLTPRGGRFLYRLPKTFPGGESASGWAFVPFHLDSMRITCYDYAVCRAFFSLSKCIEDILSLLKSGKWRLISRCGFSNFLRVHL